MFQRCHLFKECCMSHHSSECSQWMSLYGKAGASLPSWLKKWIRVLVVLKPSSNINARQSPRQLLNKQTEKCVQVWIHLLQSFQKDGKYFLSLIINCDEIWVHHYNPESKQASRERCHSNPPPPKKFETQWSAGKVMSTVFWDADSPVCVFVRKRKQTQPTSVI